jgi:iron-sulfur cluster repair protein YtfE (RIC family)
LTALSERRLDALTLLSWLRARLEAHLSEEDRIVWPMVEFRA